MPQWIGLPVLPFSSIKFSMSLLLHRILWFVLSPLFQAGEICPRRPEAKEPIPAQLLLPHRGECFFLCFCICYLPFYWPAMYAVRIFPNPQTLMGSSSQSPNQNSSPISDSCQVLQYLQSLPDPTSHLVPLVQWPGDQQWFLGAALSFVSPVLISRIWGYSDFFPPLPPPPSPQNRNLMQHFSRNSLMSLNFWPAADLCFEGAAPCSGLVSWTIPEALQTQHKKQAVSYWEMMDVHRDQLIITLALRANTAICCISCSHQWVSILGVVMWLCLLLRKLVRLMSVSV